MSSTMDRNNMPNYQDPHRTHGRYTYRRAFHRGMLIWVLVALLLVAAVPAAFYVFAHVASGASTRASSSAPATSLSTSPADQFIQSVVTEDGDLGWHQLCPSIQAQLPLDVLEQQVSADRQAMVQQGMWLSAKTMGTRPQGDGGVSHMYMVTAHSRNGSTKSLEYTVFTQRSGCVEDVQN